MNATECFFSALEEFHRLRKIVVAVVLVVVDVAFDVLLVFSSCSVCFSVGVCVYIFSYCVFFLSFCASDEVYRCLGVCHLWIGCRSYSDAHKIFSTTVVGIWKTCKYCLDISRANFCHKCVCLFWCVCVSACRCSCHISKSVNYLYAEHHSHRWHCLFMDFVKNIINISLCMRSVRQLG